MEKSNSVPPYRHIHNDYKRLYGKRKKKHKKKEWGIWEHRISYKYKTGTKSKQMKCERQQQSYEEENKGLKNIFFSNVVVYAYSLQPESKFGFGCSTKKLKIQLKIILFWLKGKMESRWVKLNILLSKFEWK